MKQLDEIKEKFTNNQDKLFEEIEPLIGKYASIALTGLKDTERTSFAELKVIAHIIMQFKPIKIVSLKSLSSQLILSGQGTKGHSVKIIPQYKVKNSIYKSHPWAIDLVIELHRFIGLDLVKIASVGIEYDGYPAHFLEGNIKKTYLRDVAIVSDEGIQSIRIAPEAWKKDPNQFKVAIKKYFEHQIKINEKIQRSTLNVAGIFPYKARRTIYENFTTCPICNGSCKLNEEDCDFCKGRGSIKQSQADNIDRTEYKRATTQQKRIFKFPVCPKCIGNCIINGFECDYCRGQGNVSKGVANLFNRNDHGYVPCERCSGENKKCYKCKGTGVVALD